MLEITGFGSVMYGFFSPRQRLDVGGGFPLLLSHSGLLGYVCVRVSQTGLDRADRPVGRPRPVCLGMYACMQVSQTGLDRADRSVTQPRPVYLGMYACKRVSLTGLDRADRSVVQPRPTCLGMYACMRVSQTGLLAYPCVCLRSG